MKGTEDEIEVVTLCMAHEITCVCIKVCITLYAQNKDPRCLLGVFFVVVCGLAMAKNWIKYILPEQHLIATNYRFLY